MVREMGLRRGPNHIRRLGADPHALTDFEESGDGKLAAVVADRGARFLQRCQYIGTCRAVDRCGFEGLRPSEPARRSRTRRLPPILPTRPLGRCEVGFRLPQRLAKVRHIDGPVDLRVAPGIRAAAERLRIASGQDWDPAWTWDLLVVGFLLCFFGFRCLHH